MLEKRHHEKVRVEWPIVPWLVCAAPISRAGLVESVEKIAGLQRLPPAPLDVDTFKLGDTPGVCDWRMHKDTSD